MACNKQIGCVLQQSLIDSTDKPIRYWSFSHKDIEIPDEKAHQECLAGELALLVVHPYLNGGVFTAKSDQNALKRILYLTDSYSKLVYLRLRLSEVEFDLIVALVYSINENDNEESCGLPILYVVTTSKKLENKNLRSLHTTSFTSRQNTCLVQKGPLLSVYWDRHITMAGLHF